MTDRMPGAFFLSTLLHGTVAAAAFLFFWFAQKNILDQPHIFELVAGPGDNYMATDAPSLGTPDGVKFTISTPVARPTPPQPVVTPESQPEQPSVVVPKVLTKLLTKVPIKPVVAPTVTTDKKRMSLADFQKNNPTAASSSKTTAPKTIKPQKINGVGIANGLSGVSSNNTQGGAGGKAVTREESDALAAYYSMIQQHLHDAHQKPDNLSDRLQARVEFHLNANGTITGVRIIESSRNAAFDQSVLDAFRRMEPLQPPPNHQADTLTVTFTPQEA